MKIFFLYLVLGLSACIFLHCKQDAESSDFRGSGEIGSLLLHCSLYFRRVKCHIRSAVWPLFFLYLAPFYRKRNSGAWLLVTVGSDGPVFFLSTSDCIVWVGLKYIVGRYLQCHSPLLVIWITHFLLLSKSLSIKMLGNR